MQKILSKSLTINSDTLKSIAKEFGKVADKVGLRSNVVYFNETTDKKQSIYMITDGFLYCKVLEDEGKAIITSIPVSEFRTNINALPNSEDINLRLFDNLLSLEWGEKGSELLVNVSDEIIATYDIPEVVNWIEWKPGVLNKIYRSAIGFTAIGTEPIAKTKPYLTAINLQHDEDYQECYIRATNRNKATTITEKIEWFNTSYSIPSTTFSALNEVDVDGGLRIGENKNGTLLVFKTNDTTIVSRVLTLNKEALSDFYSIDQAFTLAPRNAGTVYRVDTQKIQMACYMATKLSATNRMFLIKPVGNKIFGFTKWDEEKKKYKMKYFLGGSAETYNGVTEPEQLVVDAANLLDAAKLFKGDEVCILTPKPDPEKPGARPVSVIDDDTQAQAIIGQIRQ